MQKVQWLLVALAGLVVSGGCYPDSPTSAEKVNSPSKISAFERTGACDPLVPEACAFPFPNNFYLAPSAETDTGYAVNFVSESLPVDRRGQTVDVTDWNQLDGFPMVPPLLSHFPGVNLAEVARHWDIDRSLDSDSRTILMNAETGELLPHWNETDAHTSIVDNQAFITWPTKSLDYGTRYIVAMRNLRDLDGNVFDASPAFAALRDGTSTSDPDVEGRREVYEDIFDRLEDVGVERSEVQLAWDFVTASERNETSWMLHMRDDSLSRLADGGPRYEIMSVELAPNDEIYKTIHARMRVPSYLTTIKPTSESRLVIGEDGLPEFQGWIWVPFLVNIPRSVADDPSPSMMVEYGHGLFGSQQEITYGWSRGLMDRNRYVAFAVDWWGMAAEDLPSALGTMATDVSDFVALPERLHQGMLNFLMLTEVMTGDFVNDPEMAVDGIRIADPEQLAYYGNSQGGILGGVFVALSKRIDRGVLGVAGTPYSLMLPRSADFTPYYEILKARYPNAMDQQMLIALFQMFWDKAEPAGYLNRMTDNPFEGSGPNTLLFQTAIGDAQVPNLSGDVYARSVGATLLQEPARDIWGLAPAESPTYGSSYVEFDFHVPDVPTTNTPPDKENDTHEDARRVEEGQDQLDVFIRTGEIVNFCSGGCDPN